MIASPLPPSEWYHWIVSEHCCLPLSWSVRIHLHPQAKLQLHKSHGPTKESVTIYHLSSHPPLSQICRRAPLPSENPRMAHHSQISQPASLSCTNHRSKQKTICKIITPQNKIQDYNIIDSKMFPEIWKAVLSIRTWACSTQQKQNESEFT